MILPIDSTIIKHRVNGLRLSLLKYLHHLSTLSYRPAFPSDRHLVQRLDPSSEISVHFATYLQFLSAPPTFLYFFCTVPSTTIGSQQVYVVTRYLSRSPLHFQRFCAVDLCLHRDAILELSAPRCYAAK